MAEDVLALMEIRKKYALIFPDSNLHHLIPTSRQGDGSEFNLFPYKKESHLDYHFIFWNLRVDQVWDMLEDIHCSIFESKTNYIYCWWYGFCELEKGTFKEREKFEKNKQKFLAKLMPVKTLQRRWEGAFSGYDLSTASKLMKIMLLFMIFGTLFDAVHLSFLAFLVSLPIQLLLEYMVFVVEVFSKIPAATISFGKQLFWIVLLLYIPLSLFVWFKRKKAPFSAYE